MFNAFRVYVLRFSGHGDVGGFRLIREVFFWDKVKAEKYRQKIIQDMEEGKGGFLADCEDTVYEEYEEKTELGSWDAKYFKELMECHEVTGMVNKDPSHVAISDVFWLNDWSLIICGVNEIKIEGETKEKIYQAKSLLLRHWMGRGGFMPEVVEYYTDLKQAELPL